MNTTFSGLHQASSTHNAHECDGVGGVGICRRKEAAREVRDNSLANALTSMGDVHGLLSPATTLVDLQHVMHPTHHGDDYEIK